MHKSRFYNKFIICLYMFQALLCSSSGGQNCIIQHLVSSRSVGDRPVHSPLSTCAPDGHTLIVYIYIYIYKGKSVPLQTQKDPERSRNLRFPDFVTTAQDGGKVVSLTHGRLYHPGNTPGTHFCSRLCRSQGHSAIGRIMPMKNSNYTIWNQTSDLPI